MSDIATWQIIMVDDEPDSLDLVCEMLSHEGAEVHQATGGEECIALLESLTPTLIVVDLSMPKPDGWDVLAHVRSTPALSEVLVVAVTAYHSETVRRQATELGFDAYVPKPLRTHQLLDTLRELVG